MPTKYTPSTSEVQDMIATAMQTNRREFNIKFDQLNDRADRYEKTQARQEETLTVLRNETSEQSLQLGKIEERIIGIDGNGTGRVGAVQRLEKMITHGFESVQAVIKETSEENVSYRKSVADDLNQIKRDKAFAEGTAKFRKAVVTTLKIIATGIVVGCTVELFKLIMTHYFG
jgi:hypothetical protein